MSDDGMYHLSLSPDTIALTDRDEVKALRARVTELTEERDLYRERVEQKWQDTEDMETRITELETALAEARQTLSFYASLEPPLGDRARAVLAEHGR